MICIILIVCHISFILLFCVFDDTVCWVFYQMLNIHLMIIFHSFMSVSLSGHFRRHVDLKKEVVS